MHAKERRPASEVGRCLDNALRAIGRRVHDFALTKTKVRQFLKALKDGNLTLTMLDEMMECIVVAMDKGPPQYAWAWWVLYAAQINVVFLYDNAAHGCWNAVKMALRHVGYWMQIMDAQIIFNYRSGPWGRETFGATIINVVQDLSATIGPKDRLLERFWNPIAAGLGLNPETTGVRDREE